MRVRVEELQDAPTILQIIHKMFDAKSEEIYIVASGTMFSVTLKIEILEVKTGC